MSDSQNPISSIEQGIIDRLVDEHKILQDKIDKIGAFRFTIKGWCVTLIVAALFAGKAFSVVSHWLWILSVGVLLVSFFLYEKQQTDLRYRFGRRSLDIEGVITRMLRKAAEKSRDASACFVSLHYIPGISHYLRSPAIPRKEATTRLSQFWKKLSRRLRPYLEAELAFYIALAFITVVFAFSNGKEGNQTSGIVVINGSQNKELASPLEPHSAQSEKVIVPNAQERPKKKH